MIADKRSPIILYTVIAVLFVLSLFGIYKEYRGAKSYTFDPALYPSPSDSCVFSLPKGNYTIDISYGSQTDLSITLKTDNDYVADIPLPADNTFVSFPFSMEHPTD
ncbi:MAG: hypothetical protein K5888_12415, partial [Lachnospiraceae bacterium]|nr:hypothetical protein [Lachnospiraceae bacterium]